MRMLGSQTLGRAAVLLLLSARLSESLGVQDTRRRLRPRDDPTKDNKIDGIVASMTVTDLGMQNLGPKSGIARADSLSVLQMHMTFANNIVGPRSENELYGSVKAQHGALVLMSADYEMRFSPGSPVGVIHD